MNAWITLLTITYPIISHICIHYQQYELAIWGVITLILIHGLNFLLSASSPMGKIGYSVLTTILVICVWLLLLQNESLLVLLALPVIITLSALYTFANSLLPNHVPLITKLAKFINPGLSQEEQAYTVKITWVWTLFLVAMLIEVILLGWFAPIEVWSLFANVLNYIFLAILMLTESTYRSHRFDNHASIFTIFKSILHSKKG